MKTLEELKKDLLADGIIDADEVKELEEVLYEVGLIDKARRMLLNGKISLLRPSHRLSLTMTSLMVKLMMTRLSTCMTKSRAMARLMTLRKPFLRTSKLNQRTSQLY